MIINVILGRLSRYMRAYEFNSIYRLRSLQTENSNKLRYDIPRHKFNEKSAK